MLSIAQPIEQLGAAGAELMQHSPTNETLLAVRQISLASVDVVAWNVTTRTRTPDSGVQLPPGGFAPRLACDEERGIVAPFHENSVGGPTAHCEGNGASGTPRFHHRAWQRPRSHREPGRRGTERRARAAPRPTPSAARHPRARLAPAAAPG